jgi:hypothetical protein
LGYVESNLLPDEAIVYKATLHWKIFILPVFITSFGIGLLVIQPIVAAAVILLGLVLLIRAFIEYKSSEFALTTKGSS